MDDGTDLINLVQEKIDFGDKLLHSLEKFKDVDGKQKLQRKITQEIKFLKKVI